MLAGHLVANFFAGAFLCNCVPHLISGLRGEPFPTPFAKRHGVGNSSALLNFFWGSLNLFAGIALLSFFPVVIGMTSECASFLAGFVILGAYLSRHFEKVRKVKKNQ
jgi:hypothetical protein